MNRVLHCRDFDWQNVPVLAYKHEGTHFSNITRRVLFEGGADLPAQLRYFEIATAGHSTLERHQHIHIVMVLRGRGKALLGDAIHDLKPFDVIHIDRLTWHQFRATEGEPFGFLCMVNTDRDKPQRPSEEHLRELRQSPAVAQFLRV